MPRAHKTPLIQKLAKHACITYRVLTSSADGADTQSELISSVTAGRAADLKIAPRKSKPSSGAAGLQSPPVIYTHIYETEVFSMGVFLLWPGASTPLHDHPDMKGIYGAAAPRAALSSNWPDADTELKLLLLR